MNEKEKGWFPPQCVSLRFCPVCGKDDRFKHVGPRHERPGGGRCSGNMEVLRYDFAENLGDLDARLDD